MNMITVLRDKRNRLWNETKTFLETHRNENGLVPEEDLEVYDKMTSDVKALGDEIRRLEDQAELDAIIDAPACKRYELKPCPWCGSSATLQKHDMGRPGGHGYPGNTEVVVECSNPACRATAPHGKADDIYKPINEAVEHAIEAWNKRVK